MLVAAVVLIIAIITGGSLWIVQYRVRQQVYDRLTEDLSRSVATFANLQEQRHRELLHENALLADLPSLKALMTSHDQRTIADGAPEFWNVSGSDLFALADSNGHVLTVDTRGAAATSNLRNALEKLVTASHKRYLVADGRMFDFSVQPLIFGSRTNGTLLGYVISGYAIDREFVDLISQGSAAQTTFIASGKIVATTLSTRHGAALAAQQGILASTGGKPLELSLHKEDFLCTEADLSGGADVPLRLVLLKSMTEARKATGDINRLVSTLGLAALVLGSLLMLALSRFVTRPLELLAQGVRAFGSGDPRHRLPVNGTQEVQELSAAFARMRGEIQQTNRALLESEKLATIGRMASSVSHDLRHYLAAIYANSEFLSSPRLSEAERQELFADIQVAVHGTTDLLDALMIFARTGSELQHTRQSILAVVEKALAVLRAHPETEGVAITVQHAALHDPDATMDPKKLQRAIYNLLLNAAQSARRSPGRHEVHLALEDTPRQILVTITDSGEGVPEHIRGSLFQPFVSEGRQSGTGLGLTLAYAVAQEHGGAVVLLSTEPGKTIFRLTIERRLSAQDPSSSSAGSQANTSSAPMEKPS